MLQTLGTVEGSAMGVSMAVSQDAERVVACTYKLLSCKLRATSLRTLEVDFDS